jgi:rsbT co-antagonist protein RsbR
MKTDLVKILQKKKKQILEDWINGQISDAGLRESLMTNDELREQSNELLNALLHNLSDSNINEPQSSDFEAVHEILSGISISRARQGFSPAETGIYVFSLRDALLKTLQSEIKNDPAALLEGFASINRMMDQLGIITFETFIKGREEVILRQTDEITEISTPVIQVWEGILALPIVETESTIAILDISGVPAVDTLVAQHLIKTVSATRLMGAECIISGIRPEIAQTVVHLGIDLSNIITKATLASALKYSFSMLRLDVRKTQKDRG